MIANKLADSIYVVHGEIRVGLLTLYSVIKNEIFFLPAFLKHYRGLGVNQFLFLDDNSDDGSLEFLLAQEDCIILKADYHFGDVVDESISGIKGNKRAGILYKSIIPAKFLDGEYCIYVDADEFLLLPPDLDDIPDLIKAISEHGIMSVAASQVEMYPCTLQTKNLCKGVSSLDELLAESAYFDDEVLVKLRKGRLPISTGVSVSERMFRQYGIGYSGLWYKVIPSTLYRKLFNVDAKSSVYKTPIFRQTTEVYLVGSHDTSVPPNNNILLVLLHFKFTSDFTRRVEQALKLKSHNNQGKKYTYYECLYNLMTKHGGTFLWERSKLMKCSTDFVESGLMYNYLLSNDE